MELEWRKPDLMPNGSRNPVRRSDVYGDGMPGASSAQPSDADFASLLAGAKAGSGWELRRIYDWLGGPVGGYLRSQGVPDPEAVANETFFRAFTRIGQFKGSVSGFRSWVFTIAHNLVIDERRHTSRRPRTRSIDETYELERVGGASRDDTLTGIELENVLAMLSGLTNAQRDVVFLRVIAGLTIAETAEVMGRPPGAIKALQHRGLLALRQRLETDEGVSKTAESTFEG